jgi:glucosylceramidase
MDMPVAQQAKLIAALGPKLRRAGFRTKILGYDHNWSLHPDDAASTPPGEDPEAEYPTKLLQTRAARWIDGTAFHCYSGDPARQAELQHRFPDKGIWFTECSGSHGASDPPAQFFSDTLKWHARNLVMGITRNWGKTVVNWNLALRPDGGPHNGGCDTCTGVITVDGATWSQNAEYFTLGHLARFVEPGATRIASTSFGTTGWNGQIMDVAFRNRDGSTALVVHNENDEPRSFAVAQGGSSFDYTLPGGALATFVWKAPLDDGYRLLDPPAGPEEAVDDDAVTTWTGATLELDLRRAQRVRRVVLDTGADTSAPPQDYTLSTSTDGVSWQEAATGTGTGQLTTIDVPATQARYLRVAFSAPATLADARIYR